MPSPGNSVRTRALVEEIEGLLDALCAQPTVDSICEHCGSKQINLDATIRVADSERSWNVLLPVCPQCDRAGYLKLISNRVA